jgi:hypothetical protein
MLHAETVGLGSADLNRIEVAGVPVKYSILKRRARVSRPEIKRARRPVASFIG